MIDNLAKLHQKSFGGKFIDEIRTIIEDAYYTHHAFSWSNDPYTSGAFTVFGPSQFSNLYPYLSRPAADSKFHIVGEASSVHHAWIVRALNSAYAAVAKFLIRFKLWDAYDRLVKEGGKVDELEIDIQEVSEPGTEGSSIKLLGTAHLQVELGMLKKGEYVKV